MVVRLKAVGQRLVDIDILGPDPLEPDLLKGKGKQMKKNNIAGFTLALLAALFLISGQALAGHASTADQKTGKKEYILSVDQAGAEYALKSIFKNEKSLGPKRFTTLSEFTGRAYYVIETKEEEADKGLSQINQKSSGVTVSPVVYRYLENTLPDDPYYTQQWCHSNPGTKGFDMASDSAWDITTGSRDVVVAVLDSGVDYTHPDLAANIWVNEGEIAGNHIDDDGNGYVDDIYGIDSGDGDSDPMDYDGHGTHCAGIIGASGNNGIGVAGVNWQVGIMALKGFEQDSDGMSTTMELEAINYLLYMKTYEHINIVAVNASFGFTGDPDTVEQEAIEALGQAGILFVAAAGNDAANNDSTSGSGHYPSSYPLENIISVAATDSDGGLAYFSNYGAATVDLGAPGQDILSTYLHETAYEPDPGNAVFYDDLESGTGNFTLEETWAITQENASSPSHALSDSPGGTYEKSTDIAAISRTIDLSGIETPLSIGFKALHEMEQVYANGYFDALQVWYLAPGTAGEPAGAPIVPEAWQITLEKAASGISSWTDSPGGEYTNNKEQWLLSPGVDLSKALPGTEFKFKLTGIVESGYDSLDVYFSKDNGDTWSESMLAIDGDHTAGWEEFSIAVPDAYLAPGFMAAFVLTTDYSVTKDGIYLDDVEIAHGQTVFFFDDVEDGMGLWREPGSEAVAPTPARWEKAGEFAGSSDGAWKSYSYEIPPKYFWDGFKFKFVMSSDYSIQKDGVYIDDIGIGVPENTYGYEYLSGTSMATPQVTGAAALVASAFGQIGSAQIKSKLLKGSAPANALDGKTLTGGHLNLFGALADLGIDSDDDTVPDYLDNCSLTANPDQKDTDNDGYGNMCDCDLDNNGRVDRSDFITFRQAWGTSNADTDFDGSGTVDRNDFIMFRQRWGTTAPFE